MTPPTGSADNPLEVWLEADPDLGVAAGRAATPGRDAEVRVHVRNTGPAPHAVVVAAIGLDPAWGAAPRRLQAVEPDEPAVVALTVTPPVGTPAGSYPFIVTAQAFDDSGAPLGAGVQVDGTLVVGDASGLSLTVVPAEPRGVRGRKVSVDLDNRGTTPVSVDLAASASAGLRIRLSEASPRLGAGETARIRAKLKVDRAHLFGQTRRLPFVLTAQGRTTPQRYDGVFVARPMFGRMATRALALLVVLALWATAALVGIEKISNRAHHQQTLVAGAASSGPASPSPSSSAGSGASGSNGGSNGGSSGSGASGSNGATGANASSSNGTARVNGTVTGSSPGGVTVTLAPTSLVDEAAEGATFVGVSAPTGRVGKVAAQMVSFVRPETIVSTTLSTTTQADGSWAFAGVRTPGYYLLTFSKPGYQTKRYIISPVAGADPTPLKVDLEAGDGHLSGTVTGPDGPLGGVDLTITDGTVTIATTTPTTGAIGSWAVDGISTPGTYLVSASRHGYDTESTLVKLPAGGSLDGVNLTLHAGVESLVGTVSAPDDSGAVGGIGGVTVSVTNGAVTRTATTVTTGPVGHYTLPQLPVPSSYTVTISGQGFATHTAQVDLAGGEPEHTLDALLSPSTATVTGTVDATGGTGLVGAGIVLTGDNGIYKTTTVSDPLGGFRITGVVPGSYVLSAEKFGYITQYAQLDVAMGTPSNVNMTLPVASGEGLPTSSHVRGRVTDSRTGGQITCPNIDPAKCVITATTVDRRSTGSVTLSSAPTPPDQEYVLPPIDPNNPSQGLLPGLHAITISAPGYESQTVMVQVPLNKTVEAPPVALLPAATITGTVVSAVGTVPDGTCVVAVPLAEASGTPQCNGDPKDGDPCTMTAPSDALCGFADSNGAYTVAGIPHGMYQVYVVPGDAEYLGPSPIVMVLKSGDIQTYNPLINRLGRLAVTVLKPNSSGTPVAASGETVTVTPGAHSAGPTDNDGLATITGLTAGSYTVSVTDATDSALSASASVSVGLNQTLPVTLVLTSQTGVVRGRVVYTVDGVDQPVPNASLFVTGVVGYAGTYPLRWTMPVTTDAQGCFALTPDGTPPPASGTGPCGGAAIPAAFLPLITQNVDVYVDATGAGFGTSTQTGLAITGSNPGSVRVVISPPPTAIAGTVAVNPAASADLSHTTIQVVSKTADAGNLSFSVAANGAITWEDSALGSVPNLARAGSYTLRASLPGYDDAVSTIHVPVKTDGSTFSFTLTLNKYGSLKIYAVDGNSNPVPDALYVLTGTGVPATSLSPPPGGNSVTFPNLSPSGSYQVRVQASGYVFTTSSTLTVAPGVTTPYNVTLPADGAITGTISGSASGQSYTLQGATITATDAATHTHTFSTTSRADGTYTLTGTATEQGLDPGDWTVSVSNSGYNGGNPSTAQVTIPAGGGNVTHDVTLAADPVTLVVTVQPSAVKNATVTLQNSSGTITGTPGSGNTFTFANIDPVQYSLQVVAANYAPLSTSVTLQAGVPTQTMYVTLASRTNSVTGTVMSQRGTETPQALSGATVQAYDTSNNAVGSPVQTDSSGGYQIDGLLDGTYTIHVSATGYAPAVSSKMKLSSGQIASYNVTLSLYSHQLTLTVNSSVPGVSLENANVTLTPTGSTGTTQGPQAVGTTGTVVFPQVYTDTYTVTVDTTPVTATKHYGGPINAGTVVVSANATAQTATVTVNELELKVTVAAQPSDTSLGTTVSVTPPSGPALFSGPITADPATEHDIFVPAGVAYTVTATATGYVDATYTTKTTDTVDTVALVVQQLGKLKVTVTDAGTDVSGATVTLSGGPTSAPDGTTAADGTYTFTGLAPGSYTASATTTDTPPKTGTKSGTVTAGTEADITIPVS